MRDDLLYGLSQQGLPLLLYRDSYIPGPRVCRFYSGTHNHSPGGPDAS